MKLSTLLSITGLSITGISLLVAGCAGGGSGEPAQTGSCAGGQCTGVCVDMVKAYARERLGTEATDVSFSFGSADPLPSNGSVTYFRTAACPNGGEYQAEFFGTSQSCSNVFRGELPKYVGKLLVVPKGCPS